MVVRHHHHIIAIEAFKRSYAQVPFGRLDPDEHRGKTILARMKVNLVGRKAKERVRGRHMLSFDLTVKPIKFGVGLRPRFYPGHSISVGTHVGLNSKGDRVDRLCRRFGVDLPTRPCHIL
jgi:hypothetical protein